MTQIILRSTEREIVLRGDADARSGWTFSDLIDWWGLSDNKLGARERPQAHGAFQSSRSLRSSKAISFNARFLAATPQTAEAAIDDLGGLGSDGPVLMIVTAPSGSTQRSVSIDAVTRLDQREVDYGTVSVDVLAADPRRYDVEAQAPVTTPAEPGQGRVWPAVWPLVWPGGGSTGRITLTNAGRAPSAPTFILSGGFDTALITCLETGARIGFNRPVPVGSEVVIDTANRRATIDGVSDVSRWLQFREWETVPAGSSRTFQFDATGVVVTTGAPVEVRRNHFKNTLTGTSLANLGAMRGTLSNGAGFTRLTINDALVAGMAQRLHWVNADRLPVVPGQKFKVDVEVRTTAAAQLQGSLLFYTAAGAVVNTTALGPLVSATGASFVPLTVEEIAPAGAATVQVQLGFDGVGARAVGDTIDARRITDAGLPWFNGSSQPSGDISYQFVAAADASESIEVRTPRTVTATLEGQVRSAWW